MKFNPAVQFVEARKTDGAAGLKLPTVKMNATNSWVAGPMFRFRMAGVEEIRLGTPPNPAAFLPGQTEGPGIGLTWDPVIDHGSFKPEAYLDLLGIHLQPTNAPTPAGTFLCVIGPASIIVTEEPGVPFAVEIPENPDLVGVQLFTQAASIDAEGMAVTNAIDIVIGTR